MKNTPLVSPFTLEPLPGRWRLLLAIPALSLGLAACDRGGDAADIEPSPEATRVNAADANIAANAEPAAAQPDCASDSGIDYLCGPRNAEDLVQIGDSRWLLASGMDGQISGGDFSGGIHLIDSEARTFEVLFPGEEPQFEQDMQMFGGCPAPLDTANFSAHGLALNPLAGSAGRYRLYVTSHGAREAIEAFELDASGDMPSIKWVGCVPMPETAWTNSVAILPDGGFYATQFIAAGSTIDPVLAGEITGHVFEWHPGQEVSVVEGSELSGANGIAIGEDADQVFVAAYGTQEVLRFDMSSTPPAMESVKLENIHPDNLRWTEAGTLYTAGGTVEACGQAACGWAIMEIDPRTLQASRIGGAGPEAAMQGVSTALKVGDDIWLGTYAGDRVGIISGRQNQ